MSVYLRCNEVVLDKKKFNKKEVKNIGDQQPTQITARIDSSVVTLRSSFVRCRVSLKFSPRFRKC